MERPESEALAARRAVFALLGILGVFASAFAFVRATNFGGWDEWPILSLTAERIIDLPYENRPLSLLFNLPGAIVAPDRLVGFFAVHAAYLCLGGWLVFRLAERLVPESPAVALLAGVLAVAWAPLDYMRLDVVLCSNYAGAAFGTLLAVSLLLESKRRGRLLLLAISGIAAALVLRCLESTAGLLVGAPLLLWAMPEARRRGAWTAGFLLFVLPAVATAAWPLLAPGAAPSYQTSGLGVDLSPAGVLGRLARQLGFQLLPLVGSDPRELLSPAVPLAVAALVVAARGASLTSPEALPGDSRPLVRLLAIGAAATALSYFPLVLSKAITTPARTQMLAAPGMGLFLAAFVALAARALPLRGRGWAAIALAAWIVAVGTGRTVAMQREWDPASSWPYQGHTLRELVRQAPDLAPHTFVLVLDDTDTWPATLPFHLAVRYLYEGRALGAVPGREPFLYPVEFGPEGLSSAPWPVIRRAWRSPVTRHRFDELLVVRQSDTGAVTILDEWPTDPRLPALPPGARYAPRERIVAGAQPSPRARILASGGP